MKSDVIHEHAPGLWQSRYALRNLILKDFRIRYRNMSLGILWSVINPLVMLGVLVFVFTHVVGQNRAKDFPIQVLTGIIVFNFFSQTISATTTCIIANTSIIKRVIFPRVIIPMSVVFSQLLHFMIQLLLLALFLILFRIPPTWMYLWLPVVFMVELIFIMGLSLILATLNVYFRDVHYMVLSGLTILFWFTPIFYKLQDAHLNLAAKFSTWFYFVYLLNPLAGCVNAARHAILWNSPPDAIAFGMASIVAVVSLLLGVFLFHRFQRNFADHL